MPDQPPQPKKRRSFGFWAAIVLVIGGVLYPLSFGPACWLSAYMQQFDEAITVIYQPMLRAFSRGPLPVQNALGNYIFRFAAADGWGVLEDDDGYCHFGHYGSGIMMVSPVETPDAEAELSPATSPQE